MPAHSGSISRAVHSSNVPKRRIHFKSLPSHPDKMDKLQKKRLSKVKVSTKSRYQANTDIVYGRNLDANIEENNQQLPMEHDWRFVIPNIRENANIFIGTYVRAHDNFSNVVNELNHLSRSNSEDHPETHEIEIIE